MTMKINPEHLPQNQCQHLVDKDGRVLFSFDIAQLQTLNMAPGDVLLVKLVGEDFDVDTMESLKQHINQVFPNNQVLVFMMPKDSDIKFEKVKVSAASCGDTASYCSDCTCGKKERANA
ncbi:MAG: hypothetical protein OIN85_00675 [Candidatus Methanoperedens sp.]|nr:hypothetical protein [Candidatus Methanoperedens sp.]